MKKSIWIFLLAVLLPSVVLGWLALRSTEEQQIILERRTAELYQKETDAVADAARAVIDAQRRSFADAVAKLLAGEKPSQVARDFSARLAVAWPQKAVGFALGGNGKLLSPSAQSAQANPAWQHFLTGNGSFLSGAQPAQVYAVPVEEFNKAEVNRRAKSASSDNNRFSSATQQAPSPARKFKEEAPPPEAVNRALLPIPAAPAPPQKAIVSAERKKDAAKEQPEPTPQTAVPEDRQELRKVAPQRLPEDQSLGPTLSNLSLATADFPALTTDADEGVVTRFTQDRLEILFWMRPPQARELIFGCLLEAASLSDLWLDALPAQNYRQAEFVIALLDDKARPVATQPPGETGRDWKRPFVASEIGEALPHWEAALYLMRPQQLEESARSVRRTLALLIAAALGAIACGGWVVVADARRQMALAEQKTDFVSNVSHELKTPLTSIRMFAELMQNGAAETKRAQYLRIIMFEAERLTRLINNVLDFARLERRQMRYEKRPLDLHMLIARTWEGHELHLREAGFATNWVAAPPPYPVIGDEDALVQILVNLLSNAEKYAGERKEVELRTTVEGPHVCVSILDRGLGVPRGQERQIFEAFQRAHDSLASGIQGSGLGLTLAQRLAREHGGEIVYEPREGGGSCFTLRLPRASS